MRTILALVILPLCPCFAAAADLARGAFDLLAPPAPATITEKRASISETRTPAPAPTAEKRTGCVCGPSCACTPQNHCGCGGFASKSNGNGSNVQPYYAKGTVMTGWKWNAHDGEYYRYVSRGDGYMEYQADPRGPVAQPQYQPQQQQYRYAQPSYYGGGMQSFSGGGYSGGFSRGFSGGSMGGGGACAGGG